MSLNRVCINGRLTRDPESRFTPQGVAVTNFSIAVDRFTKDANGEKETDFFNIVCWRKTAEFVGNYLTKGRLVSVDGRLQTRHWIDQTTGQKRTAFEIVAENVNGLDKRPDAEQDNGEGMPEAVSAVEVDPLDDDDRAYRQSAPTKPRVVADKTTPTSTGKGATATATRPPIHAAEPEPDEPDPFLEDE